MGEDERPEHVACCDPLEYLKDIVGEDGEVLQEYGGYAILVKNSSSFPWPDVFRMLLRLGHSVWVELMEDRLVIISKPIPD